MTKASASSIASDQGLKLKFTNLSVPAGDTRGGIVVSQIQIAGSMVDSGTTVELTIGVAPPPPTTVPASTSTTTTVAGGD